MGTFGTGIAAVGCLVAAACVPSYQFSAQDDGGPGGGDSGLADGGGNGPDGTAADGSADGASLPDGTASVDAPEAGKVVHCHSGGGNVYALCPVGREACCGIFAAVPDFCVAIPDDAGACHSTDPVALIECDAPDECPGGSVCCAENLDLGNGTYTAIHCVPSGSCNTPAAIECGNMQDGTTASACPAPQHCTQSIDDYFFCN